MNPLLQRLANDAMEMVVSGGFRELMGTIGLAVFPQGLYIISNREGSTLFEDFTKAFTAKFPDAPVQFLEGKSKRITDLMVVGVVEEVMSALRDSLSVTWESTEIGELIIFEGGLEDDQKEDIRQSLAVFGSDGKRRRLVICWDSSNMGPSMETIELNKKTKEDSASVTPKKKILKGVTEISDADRARNIPITKENLIDLKIVLSSANTLEEILEAMDKVGTHGLN
ncbi:MAG: hypothetical protein WC372_12535 [Candidatus Neomarinimicrobiota bacterium]|jgi:hypothetical protein